MKLLSGCSTLSAAVAVAPSAVCQAPMTTNAALHQQQLALK
jgi:hypothetical protein